MTTKTQFQNKIQALETELAELKSQLSSYKEITIETASIGDVLEDGSIIFQKSKGVALLVAPKSTEVRVIWSKEFPEVFQALRDQGFTPSQWFVPTKEQLRLAYETIPNEFSIDYHWSSTEIDAKRACNVFHDCGNVNDGVKTFTCLVRAFRCVTY